MIFFIEKQPSSVRTNLVQMIIFVLSYGSNCICTIFPRYSWKVHFPTTIFILLGQHHYESYCINIIDGAAGVIRPGRVSDSHCFLYCEGDHLEVCGGFMKLSVYRTCKYHEILDVILLVTTLIQSTPEDLEGRPFTSHMQYL